jgi:hypothetical protein
MGFGTGKTHAVPVTLRTWGRVQISGGVTGSFPPPPQETNKIDKRRDSNFFIASPL